MSQPESNIELSDLPFAIGSGRLLTLENKNNPWRLKFKKEADASLTGEIWFGADLEGPPGHVHGGMSALILDEAMGSAGWLRGYPCVAAKIEVEFLEMTPINQNLKIKAWVEKIEDRKIIVHAEIFGDIVYSRAVGYFSRLKKEFVEQFAKKSAPHFNVEKFQYRK